MLTSFTVSKSCTSFGFFLYNVQQMQDNSFSWAIQGRHLHRGATEFTSSRLLALCHDSFDFQWSRSFLTLPAVFVTQDTKWSEPSQGYYKLEKRMTKTAGRARKERDHWKSNESWHSASKRLEVNLVAPLCKYLPWIAQEKKIILHLLYIIQEETETGAELWHGKWCQYIIKWETIQNQRNFLCYKPHTMHHR